MTPFTSLDVISEQGIRMDQRKVTTIAVSIICQRSTALSALSHMHNPEPNSSPPEPILPPAIIVSPIQWSLDDQIAEATRSEPPPPGGPEGQVYVPTALC